MNGLRFLNIGVQEESWYGAKAFLHKPVSSGKSDFEAIFEPVFTYFENSWFSPEEIEFQICEDREAEKYIRFSGALSAGHIPIIAPYVASDWNEIVVFHVGRPIEAIRLRRKINPRVGRASCSDTKKLESALAAGEITLIHNWDGRYWEIYSVDQRIMAKLVEFHSRKPGIEIYVPVFSEEYPEPSGAALRRA